MIKQLISILILTMLAGGLAAQDGISVSQSLSKGEIAFEDSVFFEVTLTWGGSQFLYRFLNPLNPQIDRMQIRGFTSTVSSAGAGSNETTSKLFRYTLAPTASGLGYIAPVTIGYVTWPDSIPGEVTTEAMSVRISEPRPVPPATTIAWWWLIPGGLLVLGVPVAILIMRRRRHPAVTEVNPDGKLIAALADLKRDSGNDLKRFQAGLCKLLDDYIRVRTGVSPESIADDQLAGALTEAGMAPDESERMVRWFTKARLDKYRPIKAEPGEVIRLESEIRSFFESK
jgi:hypothetical protein